MTARSRAALGIVFVVALASYAVLDHLVPPGKVLQERIMGIGYDLVYRHPILTAKIALRVGNERTKGDVIEGLLSADDIAGVPLLLGCLDEKSARMRLGAIGILGHLEDPRAVRPLIRLVRDDKDLRMWAAQALARIGEPAVDGLSTLLDHADPLVRLQAIEALGRIQAPGVDEALFRAMGDELPFNRAVAAAPLALSGHAEVADTLIRWNDIAWRATESAILALDSLAVPALIRAAHSDDWTVREDAIGYLGAIADPRSVEVLLERLEDQYWSTKLAAARALARIGDLTTAPALLHAYLHESTLLAEPFRKELVSLWGKPRTTELLPYLESSNDTLRQRAAELLALSTDPPALRALVPLLRDPLCPLRAQAVKAIESLGGTETADLLAALRDSCEAVRVAAAGAVGRLRMRPAVPLLLKLLESDAVKARVAAIDALGHLGGPAADSALVAALRDQDSGTLTHVLEALMAAKTPVPPEALSPFLGSADRSIRSKATLVLNNSKGNGALSALERMLQDRRPAVAQAAARALGIRGGDDAVDLLARAHSVRNDLGGACLEALRAIGTPAALKSLADVMASAGGPSGGGNRDERAEGTWRSPRSASSQVLGDGLDHSSPSARMRASQLMLESGDFRAVPVLVGLMGCAQEHVMEEAINALSEVYDHAVAQLESAATSRDVYVRLGACGILLANKRSRYADPILRELRNPEPSIRRWAAHILRMMDASDYSGRLRLLLHDENPDVRKEAFGALCQLGDSASTQRLAEVIVSEVESHVGAPVWIISTPLSYVTYLVQTHGAPAIDALSTLLSDADPWLQYAVWEEIADAGDTTTAPYFVALTRENLPMLAQIARSALIKLGEPALREVRANVGDKCAETRRTAAYVLGKNGTAGDLPMVERLLSDRNRLVRAEAVRAHARLKNRINHELYPRQKRTYDYWYSGEMEVD
ncbi:HEAT repeat domain-containing protein [Candidatus Fermentibacteria bacterium]|nr:HEAT repeat domain-containing protein [Candidatus Fermentibacteria bacterium]